MSYEYSQWCIYNFEKKGTQHTIYFWFTETKIVTFETKIVNFETKVTHLRQKLLFLRQKVPFLR